MSNKAKLETDELMGTQFIDNFIVINILLSQLPPEMTEVRNVFDGLRFKKTIKRNNIVVIVYRMTILMYPDNKPTMGELSDALAMPLSTTSKIVGFLVKNKYCKRLPDCKDRRIVRVVLTDKGRQNLEMSRKYIAQLGQKMLAALTTEEKAPFLAMLSKIAKTIKSDSGLSPY